MQHRLPEGAVVGLRPAAGRPVLAPSAGWLSAAVGERQALDEAHVMSTHHAGVIVWSRSARPEEGEFGEPVVLFERGDVPALE